MAAYTVITPSLAGAAPNLVAVAASDTFANDGKTLLHVKNASGASVNVTINSVQPCSQGADHDIVVAVPAGAERWIGPFPASRFNDPTTGEVTVGYSATTSITAEAVRTS